MVVIGVITGVALALPKVKGAAALGVLAGLLEFVPFSGPIVSAIPAIGVKGGAERRVGGVMSSVSRGTWAGGASRNLPAAPPEPQIPRLRSG